MTKPAYTLNFRTQTWILALGFVILAIKFAAWWISNSNALLTDALEGIINIIAGAFSLYGIWLSGKPKDQDHPYGHGKVEFFAAGVEGSLIVIAGISIITKAVMGLIKPGQIQSLDLALGLSALAGLANYLLGIMAIRRGKASRSITLEASGRHLASDAYSSAGLLLGLGIVLATGWYVLDNVIALALALIIIYTGLRVVKHSIAGLMDEADEGLMKEVIAHISRHRKKEWIDLHNMRIIKYGPDIHIDCHVTLPHYLSLSESHELVANFEMGVRDKYEDMEIFIHADPCIPRSCTICQLDHCPVRQHPRQAILKWDIHNTRLNVKHGFDPPSIV